MRVLIAVAMLAVAGCGGTNDGDADPGTGGTGGTGASSSEICVTYHPHPHSQPEVQRHDCIDETWPADAICWRTTDEPDCALDGWTAVGCMRVRADEWTGTPAGTQSSGCVLPGECIQHGIDNPPCCGDGGGLGAWDCPATM